MSVTASLNLPVRAMGAAADYAESVGCHIEEVILCALAFKWGYRVIPPSKNT